MFVKIFKILSSLLLVSVLVSVITKRELSVHVQDSLQKVLQSDLLVREDSPLLTKALEETESKSATSQELSSPKIPTVPTSVKASSSPLLVQKAQGEKPAQVQSMPKQNVYEQIEESHSDTDESYRPTISPCKVTMGFKVGTFDTRFGITREAFIEEIQAGAKLWGDQISKELFVYNPNGPLTINLVYDERQARTVDLSYLALEIENAKQAAETIKDSYEKEKAAYTAQGEAFTIDTDIFKTKYKTYDDKVLSYNASGGAPKEEYDKMMTELSLLQKESKALEERRVALIATMDTINAKVIKYNDFVAYVNTLIRKSNSLGAKKFTEGRFNPNTNTIDVYQFSDRLKLKRVITHELGHALGINHNDNIRSIMYSVNSGTTTVLTKEDIASLKESCLSH